MSPAPSPAAPSAPSASAPSSAGRQRVLSAALLVVAGIVALAVASRSGQHAGVVRALAWALLASLAVSLLLHTLGRRVVAVLAVLLSAGLALVTLLGEGHWALWIAAVLGMAGALLQFVLAPRWATSSARYRREGQVTRPVSDLEVWKAFDAGMDPTSTDFGDSLTARETAPVVARTSDDAARSAAQEEK